MLLRRRNINFKMPKKFIQPILTSNGILGGSSFAVGGSGYYSTAVDYYFALDNNRNTWWGSNSGNGTNESQYFIFYNPKPLCVSSITYELFHHYSAGDYGVFLAGKVYGSNDNSVWEYLSSWDTGYRTNNFPTNSSVSKGNYTILVNSKKYYKYYKITCLHGSDDEEGTSGSENGFTDLYIDATYL